MATIRYKCDTCLREVELVENKTGLTTLSNCVITENCRGSLFRIRRSRGSRIQDNTEFDNNLVNRRERKIFFPFTKDIPSKRWVVEHNLGNFPAVSVFVETDGGFNIREADSSEYVRKDIDKNTLEILFDGNETGKVHAVSRSISEQDVPQSTFLENSINISPNGTLSVAVLSKAFGEVSTDPLNPMDVKFDVSIKEPNEEEIFCVEDFNGANISPWSDYLGMSFRKRRNYIIKTVNLLDLKVIQQKYDSLDDIPELTEFKFNNISYNGSPFSPIRSKNALLLLSSPPYTKSDKVLDRVIDLGERNVEEDGRKYVFSGGKLLAVEEDVERVYPPIEKDDVLIRSDNTFGPDPTPLPSITPTPSVTPSITPSATPSITPSATPPITPSVTPSAAPPQFILAGSYSDKGPSIWKTSLDFSSIEQFHQDPNSGAIGLNLSASLNGMIAADINDEGILFAGGPNSPINFGGLQAFFIDPDGSIYVHNLSGQVQKYTENETLLWTSAVYSTAFTRHYLIADSGGVYLNDGASIVKLDPVDGTLLWRNSTPTDDFFRDLSLPGDGFIYTTGNDHRAIKIDVNTGTLVWAFDDPELDTFSSELILVDINDSSVHLVQTRNNVEPGGVVFKISAAGTKLFSYPIIPQNFRDGDIPFLSFGSIDRGGNVHLVGDIFNSVGGSGNGNDRIWKYAPDGTLLARSDPITPLFTDGDYVALETLFIADDPTQSPP